MIKLSINYDNKHFITKPAVGEIVHSMESLLAHLSIRISHPLIQVIVDITVSFLTVIDGNTQQLLETDPKGNQQIDIQDKESKSQANILSIVQDLMYKISAGVHWTPKHLGLASTCHQATRTGTDIYDAI